jgi:glutathione S-transferase
VPTLYDHPASGNAYKPRLLLSHLGLPYERVIVDIFGPDRADVLLPLSPIGRVPVWETHDGERIAESAAILAYLAEGTPYVPDDRYERAQVLQWMFFEQYSHEPYIAVVRFWVELSPDPPPEAEIEERRRGGYAALDAMEGHLAAHDFFVAGRYTIADIALYAYTHVADEGGFDLARYSAIPQWLARVASQPGHVPIEA